MKILFFGDSITDAGRNRENIPHMSTLGWGFVRLVADRLQGVEPEKYEIINRGISGNRVVDLYSRIKCDCWNLNPDIISILIGVNDVWHEIMSENGVDIDRFEKVYRMMIEDTKKALPNTKLILCEPFVLEGSATCATEDIPDRFQRFLSIYDYATVVLKLAEEYEIPFLPLQKKLSEKAAEAEASYYLSDGVHPNIAGATLIANEWIKLFKEIK